MAGKLTGVINAQEAYSKNEVMSRLGISQTFWDKMLSDGLPYANIGHSRWITGQSLIEYMTTHSEMKTNGNATESEQKPNQ
jgi:hypothetical protein